MKSFKDTKVKLAILLIVVTVLRKVKIHKLSTVIVFHQNQSENSIQIAQLKNRIIHLNVNSAIELVKLKIHMSKTLTCKRLKHNQVCFQQPIVRTFSRKISSLSNNQTKANFKLSFVTKISKTKEKRSFYLKIK